MHVNVFVYEKTSLGYVCKAHINLRNRSLYTASVARRRTIDVFLLVNATSGPAEEAAIFILQENVGDPEKSLGFWKSFGEISLPDAKEGIVELHRCGSTF